MRPFRSPSRPVWLGVLAVVAIIILPVAWYLGSPLFIDTTIDEAFPAATQAAPPAADRSAATLTPSLAGAATPAPPAPTVTATRPLPTPTATAAPAQPTPTTAAAATVTLPPPTPATAPASEPTAAPTSKLALATVAPTAPAATPARAPQPAGASKPASQPAPSTATAAPRAATPVPPTAMPIPPTATAVPPTATPVPPTATAVPPTPTSLPPTATPAPPTATPAPVAPVALLRGEFTRIDALHHAQGAAIIYRLPDGQRVLRFENFRAANGPGLFVYLAGHPKPRSSGEFHDSAAVELAPLKANVGNQNYALPPDLDLAAFRSAVIYCKPFSVVFSTAELRPA